MRYVPNILTVIRMFMIPVFIRIYFSDIPNHMLLALLVFLAAGVTDFMDGYIARRFNLVSKFGIVMDPLADKLMLITVMTCLVITDLVPLWALLVILLKEGLMIAGAIRLYIKKEKHVVPAGKLGKLATAFFYLAITVLMLSVEKAVGRILIMSAVGIALAAFAYYLINYIKLHRHEVH